MNFPFACVLLAFGLNLLTKYPVIKAIKASAPFDNHQPREQEAQLTGWGKRALAAHLNSFEIFPGFAAAVIMAHLAGVAPLLMNSACVLFLLSRGLFIYFYLEDLDLARSLIWIFGFLCCAFLMGAAAFLGL